REVEVEPASRDGFDRSWLGARARGFLLAYRLATPEELAADPAAAIDAYRQVRGLVSLEEAPAFLRYNRAVTGIERGDGLEAARQLAAALEEHPRFREQPDAAGSLFARAFRSAYDAGRYAEAAEIAALERAAFPARTSAADRLLVASPRRVQELSEPGSAAEAEALLDSVRRDQPDIAERLTEAACPAAVLSALRAGDFPRAKRLAERLPAPGGLDGASMSF